MGDGMNTQEEVHQMLHERADVYDSLCRISKGVGTAEDAERLLIDPQALQTFYQWSENVGN